ncbi:MAG TPA: hypothetical protein PLU43_08215 [Lachnospiraceae bacterium]|nr:hypothetical protein [Lachnospiraceae bacterium]
MAAEKQETTNVEPITISMKKLTAGIGTVFAGVLQMLEALEPQVAKQLVSSVTEATDITPGEMPPVETDHRSNAADPQDAGKENAEPEPAAPEEASEEKQSTVTLDDITKIIVRKVKQNRSNNEKIGAILKTYCVSKVSDLPAEKYEAFVTDLSQL